MQRKTQQFTERVKQFCGWAEQPRHTLLEARQSLIALIELIPDLRERRHSVASGGNFPRRSHEIWKEDYKRFSDLPFRKYFAVFDPFVTEEPLHGDLCDDLADIYGDLWHGLQAYEAGNVDEAFSIWIDSYFVHWGRHANSALNAIDAFYRENIDA